MASPKRYLWEYGSTVDGNYIGKSGDKIGFYGTTPASQPSGANQAAVTTSVTTTATTTNLASTMSDVVTLLNQIRSDIVTLGIIKGSA